MTVISLAAAREERRPHWQGRCLCMGCRHEWEGVGPIGTQVGLECPSCSLPKGVTKHLYGANVEDRELQCDCGCEAMIAYQRQRDRLTILRCMACGADQTNTFFGDPA